MTVKRFWQYWAGLAAILGWLAYTGEEPDAPRLVKPRVALTLPALPGLPSVPDIESDVSELETSLMWGTTLQKITASAARKHAPEWSLAGVYGQGKDLRVIVRFEDDRQPLQELREGEALPSGDLIVTIKPDHICVALGNGKNVRKLPVNAVGSLTY